MYNLFIKALLMAIFSFHALASEDNFETLEEMRLPPCQTERYQEVKIHPNTHKNIAIFIESFAGKPVPQTSEVISYDDTSPLFVPHLSQDGTYEFLQKGKEPLGTKQAENDEFEYGRMEEVKNVLVPPYKFFGNLLIIFPFSQENKNRPGRCIGSGLLMGPNQVLTAGHNIYDPKRGGWAKEILFTPAQQKENKPFGEARATILKTFKGWIENKGETYDMGMLILDRPIGYQVGWAGLAIIDDAYYTSQKPPITIAGYPSNSIELLTQEGKSKISYALMREHQGNIHKIEASRLYYKINTQGGQSGSPIVAYLKELGGYFVLGIHTHAHDDANKGTRLTTTKFWAIHECREKFNMLEAVISVDSLTTVRDFQVPLIEKDNSAEDEVIWRQAANQGDIYAQYNLALLLEAQGKRCKAEDLFRQAAKKGHPKAQYKIGRIYESGRLPSETESETAERIIFKPKSSDPHQIIQEQREWFKKQFQEKQKTEAKIIKWYKAAAVQGHVDAQFNLGWMLLENMTEEALQWLKSAAGQGHLSAQHELAGIYYKARYGVKQDLQEALKWLKLAADQEGADAQNNVGLFLENQGNIEEAKTYYEKAVKYDNKDACLNLAYLLESHPEIFPGTEEELTSRIAELSEQGKDAFMDWYKERGLEKSA